MADTYEERHARGEEPQSIDKEFLRLWFRDRCDPYHDKVGHLPTHCDQSHLCQAQSFIFRVPCEFLPGSFRSSMDLGEV